MKDWATFHRGAVDDKGFNKQRRTTGGAGLHRYTGGRRHNFGDGDRCRLLKQRSGDKAVYKSKNSVYSTRGELPRFLRWS